MKKKQTAAVILICTAILLAASSALLLRPGSGAAQNESASDDTTYILTDLNVAEIGAVAVTNASGTFGLLSENGVISVVDETGAEDTASYSQTELRSFLYAASHLTGVRKLSGTSGAGEEIATTTLMLTDGQVVTLHVAEGNICTIDDDDTGYVIHEAAAALFLRAKEDFVAHTLFPDITAADAAFLVKSVTVTSRDDAYTVVSDGASFSLTEPFQQKLRTLTVYNDLLSALSSLYATGTAAPAGGLNGMGYDTPDLTVTMETADGTYTARFAYADDECFAEDASSGAVLTLSRDDVALLPSNALDLIGNAPYYYSLGDISVLDMVSEDTRATYDISGSGEDITVRLNGTLLTYDEAIELSEDINAVRIARVVADEKFRLSDCTVRLTLTVTLRDGTIDHITFADPPAATTGIPTGEYLVFVNDTCNFTVRELP